MEIETSEARLEFCIVVVCQICKYATWQSP